MFCSLVFRDDCPRCYQPISDRHTGAPPLRYFSPPILKTVVGLDDQPDCCCSCCWLFPLGRRLRGVGLEGAHEPVPQHDVLPVVGLGEPVVDVVVLHLGMLNWACVHVEAGERVESRGPIGRPGQPPWQ